MKRRSTMAQFLALLLALILFASPLLSVGVNAASSSPAAAQTPRYRNVVYYGEWSIYAGQHQYYPSYIDGSQITHLNFAFVDVDASGNLVLCDEHADFQTVLPEQSGLTYGDPYAGVLGAMVLLRDKYPNMKIGISVGGWTRSGDFPKLAASAATRTAFAKNISKFVDYLGFDFVDIDWEYPTADRDPDAAGNGVSIDKGCKGSEADTENFTLMMQAIRDELDALGKTNGKYYELSCAMSANPSLMSKIEYDKVLDIVDFANMMTYDLNGAWNGYTGHQTALYTNPNYDKETQVDAAFSVDTCVKYLEETYGNRIDYSKIVIGVAPYTRGWAGVQNDGPDPKCPGLLATATPNSVKVADGTTSGTYGRGEFQTIISQYDLKEYYDEAAEACYYYSPSTGYFFTCDNERSVAAKGAYVREKGLGGLISWMASQDPDNTIVRAMKKSLYGDEAIPAQEIITGAPSVSMKITASGNSTYSITITNNEKTVESNAALKNAELFKKTVLNPKLYIQTKSGMTFSAGSEAGKVTNQDGYAIIDLSSVYAAKSLKPGASHTFTVNVSGTADVSDILGATMTQRILTSMAEFGKQTVYGDGSETPVEPTVAPTDPEPTVKPTDPEPTVKPTDPEPTVKPTDPEPTEPSTGNYPLWAIGVTYKIGDLVVYQGKVYECIYPHTSHIGWLPDGTPTLWKLRTDLVPGETPVEPTEPTTVTDPATDPTTTKPSTDPTTAPVINRKLPEHMVTGYWHNFCNGSTNLKLSDVPSYYDMICVAFTGNTSTAGEVTFEVDKDLSKALGGYTKEEFIQDIKDLQAKGQHVIISVGGAEGRITINSTAAADTFARTLIAIIEEYGFEGVDIDLEGGAVAGTAYIASALRKVHDHFGEDLIITMAPETYYLQTAGSSSPSSYWALALEIKDILTVCYPQFYNSGSMNGYGGTVVYPGAADFITSLSTMLIEGGLRPDQVAFGVPSTSQAAGSGYVSNSVLETAVKAMVNGTSSGKFTAPKAYPTLRGVMTWSINWDATNNYAWAKAMSSLMKSLPTTGEQPTEPTEPEPTEPEPTVAPTDPEPTEPEPTVKPTDPEPTEPEPTKPDTSKDTYDATKVYTGGDTVVYKGKTYKAKWWTRGEDPETSMVWELVSDGSSGGSTGGDTGDTGSVPAWNSTTVYTGGSRVSYNGHIYEARWWVQGTAPSASEWDVWKLIS